MIDLSSLTISIDMKRSVLSEVGQRGGVFVDAGAMAVLHGGAGLGKTFAVEDALPVPRLRLLWVSFPSRPTPRQARRYRRFGSARAWTGTLAGAFASVRQLACASPSYELSIA